MNYMFGSAPERQVSVEVVLFYRTDPTRHLQDTTNNRKHKLLTLVFKTLSKDNENWNKKIKSLKT